MKTFTMLLLLLSGSAQAGLPYQCASSERGGREQYWGQLSSRLDWAKASALQVCRNGAARPRACEIDYCSDANAQPSPDPQPQPGNPLDCPQNPCGVGQTCVSGQCTDIGSGNNRCNSDFDCGDLGFHCVGGACTN